MLPDWATSEAADEGGGRDAIPGWASDVAEEAPRQGGDEDSPIGKPLRSLEDKQGDVQPELSERTRVTELAPFEVQGSTRGEDAMPTRSRRTQQTMLEERDVVGDPGNVVSGDRVRLRIPEAVRQGITAFNRASIAASPAAPMLRTLGQDAPSADPGEAIDFNPRALGAAAGAAVPFAERAAAGIDAATSERSYAQSRQRIDAQLAENERADPASTAFGRNASMVAQGLALPSAGAAAAEGLAARGFGQLAQTGARIGGGALEGAAYNVGLSRSDDASGIAGDALAGGAMGAVLPALGGASRGISHLGREAARGTASAAIAQRVSAAGPTAAQLRRAGERYQGGLPALAQEMERTGMSGATMTAPQIAARADEIIAEAGPEMGRILREASEAGSQGYREGVPAGLDRSELARRLHEAVVAPLESQPGIQARRAARELNRWVDDFQFDPDALTPEATHRLQVQLGELAGFDQARTNISREGYGEMRRILGEAVDDSLAQAGQRLDDPALAGRYADARRRYATAATVADFTGPSRDTTNRLVSPTDTIAAMGGALAGGPAGALTGVAAMAANRWFRRREHSLAAAGLDRLTRVLETPALADRIPAGVRTTLQRAAMRGPALYSAAVYSALATSDPETRAAIQAAYDGVEKPPREETAP